MKAINSKRNRGPVIHWDFGVAQAVAVFVCFAFFFVLPMLSYQYYTVAKPVEQTQEVYTSEALAEVERKTGRVAGASTSTNQLEAEVSLPEGTYVIPVMNYQFQTDFSKPDNLIVLIGAIAGLAALVLMFGVGLDLFDN